MKIEISHVSKRFKKIEALKDVTLTLEENRVYGLLGDNGAGKSTLLNLITNRIYPDGGSITADGQPVTDNDGVLGQMFLMGEQNLFPEDMSVKDGLATTAAFYPNFDGVYAAVLLEKFGLRGKQKIEKLSTGQRSLFRLILALSVNTPVLLLDEPVLGLDANHRDIFYRLLMEKMAENPCTVVISTHIIQEVAGMLDHVLILKEGELVKDAPLEALLANTYSVSGPASLVDAYLADKKPLTVQTLGGLKTANLEGEAPASADGLVFAATNLQDYFISLMREEA